MPEGIGFGTDGDKDVLRIDGSCFFPIRYDPGPAADIRIADFILLQCQDLCAYIFCLPQLHFRLLFC